MAVKQVLVLPNDPVGLKQIRDCLEEISNSMSRAEGEKDYQSTAIEDICEKFDLPKGQIKKLANIHHKSNRDAVVNEAQELDLAYEQIFVLKNSENQGAV
jgi:hypothetical protein